MRRTRGRCGRRRGRAIPSREWPARRERGRHGCVTTQTKPGRRTGHRSARMAHLPPGQPAGTRAAGWNHAAARQLHRKRALRPGPRHDGAPGRVAGGPAPGAQRPATGGGVRAGLSGDALRRPRLGPVRAAPERILEGHQPYPAVIVDRHGDLVAANDGFGALAGGVAPALLDPPVNILWVPNIPSPHATWAYSWIRPPSRSHLRTRAAGLIAGGCSRPSGGLWRSVRCGRCELKCSTYSPRTRRRCRSPVISIRSRHSRRALAIQRSAIAFARGACTGVLMIRTPIAVKTASKEAPAHYVL
jgi:MmyB-like transcription regulator ligand binding domain